MRKNFFWILFLLVLVGIADSAYLTYEHYNPSVATFCPPGIFADCGKVLGSEYAVAFGFLPLALLGFAHYCLLLLYLISSKVTRARMWKYLVVIFSAVGFVFSIYLMYLQIVVIGSICIYCTLSAATSTVIFILVQYFLSEDRKRVLVYLTAYKYKYILRQILFLFNSEIVHMFMVRFGEILARYSPVLEFLYKPKEDKRLKQKIEGISFASPIGLAAGFDYEARLTQTLPSMGFGFQSVGTITNLPCKGNPRPQLGRLPKSRSLMVNKGFRNLGADATIKKLEGLEFKNPLGVSIGKTNIIEINTQKEAIGDIVGAFKKFESSSVENSYYELNISCPNLKGRVTFYPPNNLRQLLEALSKLRIKKPVFVKMPIEKSDKEFLAILKVLDDYGFVKGVIIGNLQKNRQDPALDRKEIAMYKTGNFSGKPTWRRSNELISLTHKKYKKRFVIIGCGGVFSSQDAFTKIKLGASLVQLITGLVYEGPQLVAQINFELVDLLKKQDYKHMSDAIGVDS